MEILNVTYKCKEGMREKFLETIKAEGLDAASRAEAGKPHFRRFGELKAEFVLETVLERYSK